jgi:protein-S-isoprenylcysteine O-methyltransferase Ste14
MTFFLQEAIRTSWLIFVVYWCVSSFRLKPAAERQSISSSIPYRIPLALGAILLLVSEQVSPLNFILTPQTDSLRVIGSVICVIGLLVAIWARHILADNWSSNVTFRQGHELIQSGPYRLARHPIYTGLSLMSLGTAIAEGRLHSWLGFLILCVGFWVKLKQEESLLLRHFREEYPVYQARVKALIPFLL